jgi:hypothetical protein
LAQLSSLPEPSVRLLPMSEERIDSLTDVVDLEPEFARMPDEIEPANSFGTVATLIHCAGCDLHFFNDGLAIVVAIPDQGTSPDLPEHSPPDTFCV